MPRGSISPTRVNPARCWSGTRFRKFQAPLELLAAAGTVRDLPKYTGDAARSRASSPKLPVMNTALMSAPSGFTLPETRRSRVLGHVVESAVGAHLANAAASGGCELRYWRERNHEVDFVVRAGRRLTAIEV